MTVGAVVAQLRLDMTNFKEGLAKANSLLEQHAQYAGRAATTLGGFAAAAVAAGVLTVKFAADMESALIDMNKVLHLSEAELAAVGEQLDRLSMQTGRADEALAETLANIGKAGIVGAGGMHVLEAAAKAAVAGGGDLKQVGDQLVSIIRAYNLNASEATKVTDTLYQASIKGRMTLVEVGEAVKGMAPIAAQLGVGYEEIAAALATTTTVGYDAENSVMGLTRAMINLTNPGKQLKAALAAAGYQSGQALIKTKGFVGAIQFLTDAAGDDEQAMIQMAGGARAYKAIAALAADEGKLFAQKLVEVSEGAGAVNRAFAKTEKSFGMQWSRLLVTMRELGEDIGYVLLPAMNLLAGLARSVVAAFKAMGEAAPIVRAVIVVVVGLGAALAGVSASVILYNTTIKSSIPMILGMLSATRQMVVALATTNVTLGMVTGSFALLGTAAKTAWAAIKGISLAAVASGGGLLAVAAAGYAINAGLLKAAEAMRTAQDDLMELVDKAGKAGMVLPVGLYEDLQAPPILEWISGMREALGLAPQAEVARLRSQRTMLKALVDDYANFAKNKVEVEADAEARLKQLRQTALQNQLDAVEKERLARIKAGVDERLANEIAEQEMLAARQQTTIEILKLDAQLLEAEGKTHEARVKAIQAEAKEWHDQNEERLGETKATEGAWRLTQAKLIELDRQEAEERAKAFEEAAGKIVSGWTDAVEAMRQADKVSASEYLAQLSRVLDLIRQMNAARAAAGQSRLFEQEELRLAQTIFTERKRMQTELEAGEKKLADERKQWAQEELAERQRLNEYELSLVDLTFQHKRDLAKISGQEDEYTTAQIAREELAALQQRRAEEQLSAQERLDSLERERQLILEIAQGGGLGPGKATESLGAVFAEIQSAREEIAAQERGAFEERRRQQDETVKGIQAEQRTLRDQLTETGGRITQVAQSVFDVIERRIRSLGQIRLEPAMAGALAAPGGNRVVNLYYSGQRIAGSADVSRLADQLADLLEREATYARE